MLQFTNVRLMRGSRILFEDASFQLHAGQKLGLTGANGCGKSSLFELILGGLETDFGEFSYPSGYRIAHVSQESPSSDQSALDYVMDGDAELRAIQGRIRQAETDHNDQILHQAWEQLEAIDGYRAEARAGQLLHGLGFGAQEMQQAVKAFSGGWRMRLNLAQALMCRSDMLLLDEPTNHLDLPAIIWLEGWLQRYPGVLLLISHDRDFLDGVCNRIAHIENLGLKTYGGNYSQFETVRAMHLAQQQSMFEAQQSEIKHIQSYVDRFRYKASKARQAQSRLKMLEKMQRIAPAHVDSPFHFRFLEPGRQPQHLLHLEKAQLGYAKDRLVLQDVGLAIEAGMRIGLLGVNGAGKSTLVKALADGSTVLQGERLAHKDTRIGYFAQHQMELLDADRSPLDHLMDLDRSKSEQELRNYLGGFDFRDERIFEPVGPFSGGEKARLVLALLIRQRPNLLLLDEPTNHLDLEMRQALSLALADFEGALIVIAHDRHLLRSVCDELLIVHDGIVEPFDQTLDDYSAWLAQQEKSQATNS
ncbi:MAG TPA: ATP-binding cassette domain-containing protein, partial [Xanthomonadales bacterium]|nr:ATP-binding cassette domain-containing protein [Xanthomonadales bacterium]